MIVVVNVESLKLKIKSPYSSEGAEHIQAAVADLKIHIGNLKKVYTALKQKELDHEGNKKH